MRIDEYIIKNAYPETLAGDEIEIVSENLRYVELSNTHSGVQCMSNNNNEQIRRKCSEISKLIKEIDMLNRG